MPHIVMKCYPGRTEEQKALCAEKMAESIAETMGCPVSAVSVSIEEIEKITMENAKRIFRIG